MLRKALGLIVAAAVVGCAAFWFLTIPATVPAKRAAARAPISTTARPCFMRRLRVLPRHARSRRITRRLGGGLALKSPFGTFYRAEHLVRSERRHRRLERGGFRHRDAEGNVARRRASLSGVSLYVLPAYEARRRARPVRLPQNAAGCVGPGRAITICRFLSTSAARSAAGNCCSSTASRSRPILRSRRNGIAAPISSTAPATAPSATARAMCSAAIIAAQRFAGGPNPEGKGWVPNITQAKLGELERGRHRLSARDGR